MQLRRRALWLSTAVLVWTAPVWAEDAVTLRYRYQPGEASVYQSTVSATQVQKFNDMEFKTQVRSTDVAVRTCTEVDKTGSFRLQTENKLLKVVNDVAVLGKYTYDSQAAENEKGSALGEALTPVYDRMKGSLLTVVLSPRGEVVKVEGYQELLAEVIKDNPLGQQFFGGGSDDAAKWGLQDMFLVCPEQPVQPGDAWESTFEFPLPKLGTIKGKRVYTYEGPDKVGDTPTARIAVTTQFSFDLKIEAEGSKISGTIATTASEGTAQFDAVNGRLLALRTKVDFSGEMQVEAGGQTLNIGLKQTQETESRLLDAVPQKID